MRLSDNGRNSACRRSQYRTGTAVSLLFALGLAPLPALAQELPSGGSVTSGAATISTSGSNLLVNQASQNAIVSWQSFSVGGNASAHFENGTGATLNRVTGNLPSSIDGSLTATGSLYLINPAGVAVGAGGMVRTGGSFVASTHDTSDADFLDGGDLTLKGTSKASVVNSGFITSLSGDVVLTARRVENAGTINAPNGSVGLLGGYEVLLRDTSLADGKFAVQVGGDDTEVVNTGTLKAAEVELRANGGSVQALAGNTKAIVKATGVKKVGGRIFLTAGDGGTVKATQRIVARRAVQSAQKQQVAALPDIGPLPAARPDFAGGEVHISGGAFELRGSIDVAGSGAAGGMITATARGELSLASAAALDASGSTGGLVLLGGDYQGGVNPATRYLDTPLATAAATSIAAGATVNADGTQGDGGNVVVWSDGATTVKGQITARGGVEGNGGAIETSGHTIDFADAHIDASSPNGLAGSWLIDPEDLTVDASSATTIIAALNLGTSTTLKTTATIASGPGVVTAGGAGDITVAAPLTWTSGATLTLDAYHSIAIDAPVTIAGNGGLMLTTNNGGTGGTLSFAGSVQYTGSGGSLTINSQPYTLLYSMADLQGINTDAGLAAGKFYALAKSQDASGIPANGSGEWIPLGTNGTVGPSGVLNGGDGFASTFTGLGNTIGNLTIDTTITNAGLFGYSNGAISDIGLLGGSVNGGYYVGGLVGYQKSGSITQAYATGAVNGSGYLGGLVGVQFGNITKAYATGAVNGSNIDVGGLVGYQSGGSITQAYATGAVTASDRVGGLVGNQSSGSTTQAYVTGTVNGSGSEVGGLVGVKNGGSITASYFDSYSTGQAAGNGVGNIANAAGIGVVTSDPAQSGAANYAYKKTAYTANPAWTFTDTVGGAGDWTMIDGQTRPFGAWEYSQNIADGHQLQLVNMDLGASYTLARSIDLAPEFASATVNGNITYSGMWRGGFVPLGTDGAGTSLNGGNGFTGSFAGLGNTIANLTVDTGSYNFAGLFGYSNGVISDIGLPGSSVKGRANVGGLAGFLGNGSITQGYVTGTVTGHSNVGGLVGYQASGSTIKQAYATSTVSATYSAVGGLVGLQFGGSITQAYATGDVTGDSAVGGLVGFQNGSISEAYATGAVTGNNAVGGLVGRFQGGSTTSSYFDKDTTGQTLGVGSGSQAGVTALTSTTGTTAFDKASYAGFDWTVWAPPSPADGGAPAYYPELFGVSGVVGVAYADASRTYGDALPSFGTPSAIYGIGYFNRWTSAPGTGSVASAGAGIHSIVSPGAAATFTPGGSSRIAYLSTLTIDPRSVTVTALGGTSVYGDGGTNPGLSATNLASGEDISVLTGLSNSFGIGPTSAAGNYTLNSPVRSPTAITR